MVQALYLSKRVKASHIRTGNRVSAVKRDMRDEIKGVKNDIKEVKDTAACLGVTEWIGKVMLRRPDQGRQRLLKTTFWSWLKWRILLSRLN